MSGLDPSMLGQRIADPRVLSDELGCADSTLTRDATHPDMYSGLASYTFGSPRPSSSSSSSSSYSAVSEASESISPLTPVLPRLSPDRTPRPSVSGQPVPPQFRNVSSHPSQGAGRPASSHHAISSQSRRLPATRNSFIVNPSGFGSRTVSGSDSERSEDPTPSTDPIIPAYFSAQQRGKVMPDNASQHTFGPASRTHRATVASSQDGAILSSSSVSVATSRSSSRASMRTTEQFSSDDEYEIDIYDGSSSPVTFARDHLVDIDEDLGFVYPGPSTLRTSFLDGRRGSLPMAIPGVVQPNDAHSTRSREGSILTVRRQSRSLDDTSTHRSSHSGEDPSVILPKSEPHSRADWLSVEAQLQVKQQQGTELNVWDGVDTEYILSKRSEGSIRSFNSRLSFVQGPAGPRRSAIHLSAIPPSLGNSSALPWEDSFLDHVQKNDRTFDAGRMWWSFQREKADASSSSSRRRQQVHHHRTEIPGKETPLPKVQEMWRCGHVGRFKVDRLSIKPQSADATKGAQQRIHVRHIPDPFILNNTMVGPHSVLHKHSRAIAFSIFRSHGLFSGRQGVAGHSTARTHISMRLGIMLAPKKVQEQYTSTKAARHLSTYGLLDNESRSSRDRDRGTRRSNQSISLRERDTRDRDRRSGQDNDKEDKGKGKTKVSSRGKIKDKSDKKHYPNPTESAESSTATSSAGSVTNKALQQMVTSPELTPMRIQLSPSMSSSTTVYRHDSTSRPDSPTSLLPPSINDTSKISEGESSSIQPSRYYRDHRGSIDSDDRLPLRTTHAEAFSALDPNDIEYLRAKATHRANVDSGSTLERFFRRFRNGARSDDHSSGAQPRAFQPPWLITAGRAQQEENERVLNELDAAFRDVGLLHRQSSKPSRVASKRKSNQGVLDRVPDDSLCMLLPLWAGETDTASVHAETSSTTSYSAVLENRQYLLVYYSPFEKSKPKDKKPEKKKAKQSHSSDSGVEDARNIYLSEFYVTARVVTYDELRLTGVRVPSDGLAINGPEWEAISYPAAAPLRGSHLIDTVVCQCSGRERGFDFLEDGLLQLGLCVKEEFPMEELCEAEEAREGKTVLTPIGRAAVEMIWLGCLAITSFGPT